MANFIPVLSFGPDPELTVTFDTPPEGDPQNETLATEKEQVRSVGGQLFTSDFYDYKTFTLRFILQSNALALKLKRVFEDHALKGESFTYFPHSDDSSIRFGVELQSESVTFNRDHPDGLGGFLWSFEFTLINVNKTAPRITRLGPAPTPVPTAPDSVRNLRTTEVEQTTIDTAWDVPISTGSSQLKHYEVSIKQGSAAAVVSTTVLLTRQFTGLVANTAYTITVAAVNDDDLKSPVQTLSVTTARAPLAPPTAVRNFASSNITTTTAQLNWDAPTNSGSTSLKEYILNLGGADITVPAGTTTYQAQGLSANTAHTATIKAVNSNVHPDSTKINNTGPTTTISFRTLVAIVAPTAVQNLIASNVGEETATLRWDAPNSTGGGAATITKYQVKVSGALDSTAVDVTSGTTHALTGLTARTQYTYQVRAVNSSNLNSPWSSVTFTTETARLVPPRPVLGRPRVQQTRQPYYLRLRFTWPRVGASYFLDIDKFRVYYRKQGETSWTLQEVNASDVQLGFQGDRSGAEIRSEIEWFYDNDEPDQVYEFELTAYNEAGESPRSGIQRGTKLQMLDTLYEGTKVVKRNFIRDTATTFFLESVLTKGDYFFDRTQFGKRNRDMDMFSVVQATETAGSQVTTKDVETGIRIPDFTITEIRGITPSATDPDKLAIAFEGRRISTDTTGVFIVEVTATYDESTKRWTITHDKNDVIVSSGYIAGLTAYAEQVSVGGAAPIPKNRYMYTKWETRYLWTTRVDKFENGEIDVASIFRHKPGRNYTWYDNIGLCAYGNKFFVVDYHTETAYAYKLKERTRTLPDISFIDVATVTERNGRITSIRQGRHLDYLSPFSAWTHKSFLWVTGSSTLTSGQTRTNKLYCYTTFVTTRFLNEFNQFHVPIRVPSFEIEIDDRSYEERDRRGLHFPVVFVWKNHFFVSAKAKLGFDDVGTVEIHNHRILAFKMNRK